jgi:ABC-type multidrug transport system permease subunit
MPPDNVAGGTGVAANESGTTPSDDWASLFVSKVETGVSLIRDRTVTPVVRVVRYIIFGLVALIIAILLGVLFAVVLVRVLDNYAFRRHVWASYLVVSGIFAAFGLLCSRMRHPRT